MNTEHPIARPANHDTMATCSRRHAGKLLPLMMLVVLAVSAAAHAQFNYTIDEGEVTITRYTGLGGAVTVPDTIEGLPVTGIAGGSTPLRWVGAFEGCTGLTSVTIGNSVASIGYAAFFGCTGLASVTIGNSVTSIGSWAFSGCTGLTSVTIGSGVTSIGSWAFHRCTGLTSVTIGSSVTSIGSWAFYRCTGLAGVYFQGNVPWFVTEAFLDTSATVYYLPGTSGWSRTLGGRPTALWNPQMPTADASFGVGTNRFGFTITGASGLVIVVETCTDLAKPSWSAVGTNALTGDSAYFSDPEWTRYPARFYRLRSP